MTFRISAGLFSALSLLPALAFGQTPASPPAAPPSDAAPTDAAPTDAPASGAPSTGSESPAASPDAPAAPSEAPTAGVTGAVSTNGEPPATEPVVPEPGATAQTATEPSAAEPGTEPAPTDPPEEAAGAAAEEGEVLVLGSPLPQAAGSVQVIREKQLKRFEYDDPTQALMQVPGVFVRQEDGIGLRPNIAMRGVNPDRSSKITLMEDGILFGPAPYSAPAAYFFPLFTRMTEVRVVKGPSAIGYGPQTVAGAIDFISRPIPIETSGAADVAFGDYGYEKAHVYFGTSNEHFGFLVEGVRLQNTGFRQLPSGADTGSTRNDWMVKTSYVVDPQAAIRNDFLLKLSYNDEVSNETYLGLSDADFRQDPYARYPASALDQMNNHRTGVVLTHVLDIKPAHIQIKTTGYRFDYHRIWKKFNHMGGGSGSAILADPTDPANQSMYQVMTGQKDTSSAAEQLYIGPNDRKFVSQGVQSVATAEAMTGPLAHHVEGGVRVHQDQIRRIHTEDAYNMIGGQLVDAFQPTITTADNLASTVAVAIHATDNIRFHDLILTPGIRTELVQSTLTDYTANTTADRFVVAVLPGMGAFYEMLPGWGALAGVYRGFSPPAPGSDSTISPEYSVNYEAGSRFVKGNMRLEAIGFYNDYQNLTDVCTFSSGCVTDVGRQFDAGAARIYGIETFAGHEIPLPAGLKIPASAAYSYTHGTFANSFNSADPIYGNVVAGDDIPYIPQNQANLTLGLEHRYAGINGTVNYVGRMREVAGSGDYDPAWTTDEQLWMDLSAYVKPVKWLTIYANLRNVTNEAYIGGRRPYGARSNPPRWFQMGVKGEF